VTDTGPIIAAIRLLQSVQLHASLTEEQRTDLETAIIVIQLILLDIETEKEKT
jgi:hypothetical protein